MFYFQLRMSVTEPCGLLLALITKHNHICERERRKKKKEKKETSSLFCEVATTNMRCVMTACHNR